MSRNVAIVGIGYASFSPLTPEVSCKELMYKAALKTFKDAGIDPCTSVDSLVTLTEDSVERTSKASNILSFASTSGRAKSQLEMLPGEPGHRGWHPGSLCTEQPDKQHRA